MSAEYISLRDVVKNLQIEEGKLTEHDFLRYMQLGVNGIKELHLDVVQEVRTVLIALDSMNAATLPDDYVKYINISVCKDGRMHYLAQDGELCLYGKDSSGSDNNTGTPNNTGTVTTEDSNNPVLFNVGGGFYGIGGGQNKNGYYRVDKEFGTIQFSSGIKGEIKMDYISDGTGSSPSNYTIHIFADEALKAYIYWKSIQRRRNIPQNEKQSARAEYYNQKRLTIARFSSFTKAEALVAGRKGFKQAPKL